MAVRAKLRRPGTAPDEPASADGASPPAVAGADPAQSAPARRSRPGLLLLTGIGLLAGGAYLLVQLLVQALKAATPG
jgi:hypothetical protein